MATFEHYKLVIPANHYLITFRHTSPLIDDEIDCTIGFTPNTPPMVQGDLADLCDAWEANFVPSMVDTLTFIGATAREAAGVILDEVRSVAGGYSAGDPDPFNCAIVIKKLTGVAGRKQRGRMYVPMVGGDNVDEGGNLTTAALAAFTTAAEAFRTDVETATSGALMLLHSKGWNGGVEPADPGNAEAPTQIQALQCSPKMGTQRRRIR